ncbi:PREDICTED: glutathione S-transferase 1-like [Papilio polytes]|uniref:glutathione S-transferase 1-like n=1 Tax=Papilio polytes TaxID=76194 RepID=UPI0006763849|nr:PREDICTED: glutathione S-transferase 1-like [Papilio polytes]XP_013146439.1 PREDICTED: glutathione S-transferase 1-like [Papilio polytes]XP_013146440.1 PREDICTED: glutathione S-transferase 1-like [Papilio polytes]
MTKASQLPRLVLYHAEASPPSCAVRMLGHILDLDFHYKQPKLLLLEHKTPQFKKINPMGTIPVLQDGDFIVSESHAIMQYLCGLGGERGARLYPREERARAILHQCMYFDAAVMFNTVKSVALPTLLHGMKGATEKHLQSIEECYSVTEAYLRQPYMVGDHLTLADLSLSTTVAATNIIHELNSNRFPRTADWMNRMSQEDFYKKITKPGMDLLKKMLYKRWERNVF